VPLQELRLQTEPRVWAVDQPLDELQSLTPVRGWLLARHGDRVLEVEGEAETIITLCCHRCLQDYNHALRFRCVERLWLGGDEPTGEDGNPDDLIERLDPRGCFDPARWIFEQLSLQLPLQNRCGSDCPGPALPAEQPAPSGEAPGADNGDPPIDPRWSRLRSWR
jgi:uncharacterized protein